METTLTAPKIRSNSALGAASPHARLKDGVPTPVISPLSRARKNSGLASQNAEFNLIVMCSGVTSRCHARVYPPAGISR